MRLEDTSIQVTNGIANARQTIITNWLNSLIQKENRNVKKYLANISGYGLGLTGSLVAYTLAEDFGVSLAKHLRGGAATETIFGVGFGIISYMSLAALGGVTASDKLNALLSKNSLIGRKEGKLVKYLRNLFTLVVGAISALQYAYLIGKFLGNGSIFSLVLAAIGFVMYQWFNKDAVDTLLIGMGNSIRSYYYYQDEKVHREKLTALQKKLTSGIDDLYLSPGADIDSAYMQLIKPSSSALSRIQNLVNRPLKLNNASLTLNGSCLSKKTFQHSKAVIGFIGFGLGVLVGYAYYDVSLEAATWFLHHIHHEGHALEKGAKVFAVAASLANSALGGLKLKKRFEQIYAKTFGPVNYRVIEQTTNPKLRKLILVVSIPAGIFSAIPISYAVYDYIKSGHGYPGMLLMLVPILFAITAIRSEPFEKIFNRLITYIRSFHNLTTADKRDKLISILKQLNSKLPTLSNSDFGIAYRLLCPSSGIEGTEAQTTSIAPTGSGEETYLLS